MRHTVQEGETLSGIAAAHGIDVRDVLAANPQKARLELASGAQVFQSLAAGEDLELPATMLGASTLGGFGSFIKKYSGYDTAKRAVEKATDNKAAGTTFTDEEKATGGCADGYYYDAAKQTCVKKPPKIGLSDQARLRKAQEAAMRATQEAQAAVLAAQQATTAAAKASADAGTKKKLLIAGGVVGVVVLGIGGAVWALKK